MLAAEQSAHSAICEIDKSSSHMLTSPEMRSARRCSALSRCESGSALRAAWRLAACLIAPARLSRRTTSEASSRRSLLSARRAWRVFVPGSPASACSSSLISATAASSSSSVKARGFGRHRCGLRCLRIGPLRLPSRARQARPAPIGELDMRRRREVSAAVAAGRRRPGSAGCCCILGLHRSHPDSYPRGRTRSRSISSALSLSPLVAAISSEA